MNKIIFLIFILLIPVGILAQEERQANVRNNWISGSAGLLGAGASFERMLNSHFSIEIHAYASLFMPLILINLGAGGGIRYYPQGRIFFVGLGFGYQVYATIGVGGHGFGITPEVGWKVDVGEEGGFFIQPGIRMPLTFDTRLPFRVAPGIVPYVGFGFAF